MTSYKWQDSAKLHYTNWLGNCLTQLMTNDDIKEKDTNIRNENFLNPLPKLEVNFRNLKLTSKFEVSLRKKDADLRNKK